MSQHHAEPPDVPHRSVDPHQQSRPTELLKGGLPPYRVILLQNAGNDLMFIVRTIMELTRFCRAEATHKMWEAHHSGRSTLLVTYKERAELYAEQFHERGLTVTVEPR